MGKLLEAEGIRVLRSSRATHVFMGDGKVHLDLIRTPHATDQEKPMQVVADILQWS